MTGAIDNEAGEPEERADIDLRKCRFAGLPRGAIVINKRRRGRCSTCNARVLFVGNKRYQPTGHGVHLCNYTPISPGRFTQNVRKANEEEQAAQDAHVDRLVGAGLRAMVDAPYKQPVHLRDAADWPAIQPAEEGAPNTPAKPDKGDE